MTVPFIDLKPQTALVSGAERRHMNAFFDDMEFVGGKSTATLEADIVAHCDFDGDFIACANGTDALQLVFMALALNTDRPLKVGCPDVTFWASCEAIINAGHMPVLLDIDSHDLQLSLPSLQAGHEAFALDALVFPHLFGWCSAELEAIRAYCRAQNIFLLEDGAQSFGVKKDGRHIVADADVSTVSFYPAKVLGGCMDGGGIFVKDAVLAENIRKLGNHGRSSHYGYEFSGVNSRMSGLQARYLTTMLTKIDAIIEDRNASLALYREKIGSQFDNKLNLHAPPTGVTGNGYLQVMTLSAAPYDKLMAHMGEHGIGLGRVYPSLMREQPAHFDYLSPAEPTAAKAFVDSVINLPLYFGMTEAQIDEVVSRLEAFFND